MFVIVEVVNVQVVVWKVVEQFNVQLVVVVEGVYVVVFDCLCVSVYVYCVVVWQYWFYVVVVDCDVGGIGWIDVFFVQGVFVEVQFVFVGLQDYCVVFVVGQFDFFVEGQFDFVGIQGCFVVL